MSDMTAVVVSEIERWLQESHEAGGVSAIRRAYALLKGSTAGEASDAAPDTGVSLPSSLFIACCEEAIRLGEWEIAAPCVERFRNAAKATKCMQARALFCEGIVGHHAIPPGAPREQATERRLACAASIIGGISIAVEEWPRSAEVLVQGVDHLWSVLEVLYLQGHHRDIVDALAFVVSLHERLMIGGPAVHLQWTARYATCLSSARRTTEAIAQWQIALETTTRMRDERLQVQVMRALAATVAEREVVNPPVAGTKGGRTENFGVGKSLPVQATHATQLFLAGAHRIAGAGPGASEAVRAELRGLFERFDGGGMGGAPVVGDKPSPTTGARAGQSRSPRTAPSAQGAASGAAGAGGGGGGGAGSGAAAVSPAENEITSPEVLEEIFSDVVLCVVLAGGVGPALEQRLTAALARLSASPSARVRTFALYAQALRRLGDGGVAVLHRLRTSPDTSYLAADTRAALLVCLKDVESALTGCRVIANDAERDYAVQMGCALLWAVVQPLLVAPGRGRQPQPAQLRTCLARIADSLSETHRAPLPLLQTAVEYEAALAELSADNVSGARRRVFAALQRLPMRSGPSSDAGAAASGGAAAHPRQASPRRGSSQSVGASMALSGSAAGALVRDLNAAPAEMDAEASARHLPLDFPLAWLRHRIDVRAAVDTAALTHQADQALHAVEEAMAARSQGKRVTLLKAAFSKLPPLLSSAPAAGGEEVVPTAALPDAGGKGRARPSVSARRESKKKGAGGAATSFVTSGGAAPPPVPGLPDRATVQLYGALLDECRAETPMPEALVPLAAAVAEAVLGVPLALSAEAPLPRSPAHRDAMELARRQGEAALYLCETAMAAAEPDPSRGDGQTPYTVTVERVLRAAELGWLLCEHHEPGAWLCLSACEAFLSWHAASFERGRFGGAATPTLERLYDYYHTLSLDYTNEGRLTADLGLTVALSLLSDYIAGKGEVNDELHATSFEDFFSAVLRYPRVDTNSLLLRRALEVTTHTLQCVAATPRKAHLCMLLPALRRLSGTGSVVGAGGPGAAVNGSQGIGGHSGSGSKHDSPPPDAQEQLLLLIGRLAGPSLSREERLQLLCQDAMQLLHAGPPTVHLCGRLALIAAEQDAESCLLELCHTATELYKAGRLGWCTSAPTTTPSTAVDAPTAVPVSGGKPTVDPAAATAATATATATAALASVAGGAAVGAAAPPPPVALSVEPPTAEDWYWFAIVLATEAAAYHRRCSRVDTASIEQLGLQVLTLYTNSAIAAARAPPAAHRSLLVSALRQYCDSLFFLWSRPCDRQRFVPSLRMMLAGHILTPTLEAVDGSRKQRITRRSAPDVSALRDDVYRMACSLGVALLQLSIEGAEGGEEEGVDLRSPRGTAAIARAADGGTGSTAPTRRPVDAMQEASRALAVLRASLPARYQRELSAAEVGLLGGLGLPQEVLTQRLKGCDAEVACLAWCARARRVGRTRQRAYDAWGRALAASAAAGGVESPATGAGGGGVGGGGSRQAKMQARTMLEMTQHLAQRGWISLAETAETLLAALALVERGASEDLAVTIPGSRPPSRPATAAGFTVPANVVEAFASRSLALWEDAAATAKGGRAAGATHSRSGSATNGGERAAERPASRARDDVADGKPPLVNYGEVTLCFSIVHALWSLAPSGHADPKVAPRSTSPPPPSVFAGCCKRDYARLMVHYVECMWRLCERWLAGDSSNSSGRTLDLPASAALWFGFQSAPADAREIAQRGLLDARYNNQAVHGALLHLANYLSSEPGLEPYTFIVASWCAFAASAGAPAGSADPRVECIRRATQLLSYRAALRCGAGPAAHVYATADAEPAHWRALGELLRGDRAALSLERSATDMLSPLSSGAPATEDAQLRLDPHAGSVHAAMLCEASSLLALGRGEEARVVVSLATGLARAVNDRAALFTCELLAVELGVLLEGLTWHQAESRLLAMAHGGSNAEGGPPLYPHASPHDRVAWLELRCTLLADADRWDALASILGEVSAAWQAKGELAEVEVRDMTPAAATAVFLAREAAERIQRVCLELLSRHLAAVVHDPVGAAVFALDGKETFVVVARHCIDVLLSPMSGASLASRLAAVSAAMQLRTAEQSGSLAFDDATALDPAGVEQVAQRLRVLKEEAERMEALSMEVRQQLGRMGGGGGGAEGAGVESTGREAPTAVHASAERMTGVPALSTTETPLQSSLAHMESLLMQWQAWNGWERVQLAERLQRAYRALPLAALGLPTGGGPAHLESVVADYMRNPLAGGPRQTLASARVEDRLRIEVEWERPTPEPPAELANAFAHFGIPTALLSGAGRYLARAMLYAAVDRVSVHMMPARVSAAAALVELERDRALEAQCGASPAARRAHLRQLWASRPLVPLDKAAQTAANRRRSGHGVDKRGTGRREVAANAASAGPTPSAALELSAEAHYTLRCAAEVVRDARFRLDFRGAYRCLLTVAELLLLWGDRPAADAAAEMAAGARVAAAVVDAFARLVSGTREGAAWRQFQVLVATSPLRAPSAASSLECVRARAELLAASPMLQRLETALGVDLFPTSQVPEASSAAALLPQTPCSPPPPSRVGAAPTAAASAAAGSAQAGPAPPGAPSTFAPDLPVPLTDGSACLSICYVDPALRDPTLPPPPEVDFLVVLHHPDGATDARMSSVPRETLAAAAAELAELLAWQRENLLTQEGNDGRSFGRAAGLDAAGQGGLGATFRESAGFYEALGTFLERLDLDVTSPLVCDFAEAVAFYCAKQPLYLCLDPLLQPLPLEHGGCLMQPGGVQRELSVFALSHDVGRHASGAMSAPRGVGKVPAGGAAPLLVFDPLGDRRAPAEAGLASELLKQRAGAGGGGGGGSTANVRTCGGGGLPVSAAAVANALQHPGTSALVLDACGPLARALPAAMLCSSSLDHVQVALLAAGAVNRTSAQREEREGLGSSCAQEGGGQATTQPPDWLIPLLMVARGVRFVSTLWYPLSPTECDVLCQRSAPGLMSGKGLVEASAPAANRGSTVSLSKGVSGKKRNLAIHYGLRPSGAAKAELRTKRAQ